jgi:hypothetical protein
VLHELLGVELRDQVVGKRAGPECHRDAARIGLLHEARELQEALTFQPTVRQRATDQVDVTDLGLVMTAFNASRMRSSVGGGSRAAVFCPSASCARQAVGAEGAAHRDAVQLMEEYSQPGATLITSMSPCVVTPACENPGRRSSSA